MPFHSLSDIFLALHSIRFEIDDLRVTIAHHHAVKNAGTDLFFHH